jgi:DNA-binding IclR family transcriptional regulator
VIQQEGRQKNMKKTQDGVQSVDRIFAIIEALAANPHGLPLQAVAGAAGLAKSTAHRLLASLISLGYAQQDETTGQYRLTLKMFELSSNVVSRMDVFSTAKPYLDQLAMRTGEAIHLVIRDGADVIYLYKAEAGGMRMASRIGLRVPMYCTGVGKAILATLSPAEVENIWKHSDRKAFTPHTITVYPQLLDQLTLIKKRGWSVDDEENEPGVRCVAVALPGIAGRANAAFSIASLAPNMYPARMEQLAHMALLTQKDILRGMGAAYH